MNALDIWIGHDYAWYECRGRGEEYRAYAQRIRVIKQFKRTEVGNIRDTTFILCRFLNDDGTHKQFTRNSYVTGEPIRVDLDLQEVKSQDIALRWEEYEVEREGRNQQIDWTKV